MTAPRCAVLPRDHAGPYEEAVRAAGGVVVPVDEAEALVWVVPRDARRLRGILDANPDIRWVQVPYAGVENFVEAFDHDRQWTCGKGVYAEPVAEHALGLALAGLRHIAGYARARHWTGPVGRNLLGSRVTVLGGGEITSALVRLLAPFEATVTVVRRHPEPIAGASEVVPTTALHDHLSKADLVVLALALTPETKRIIDTDALAAMPDHAWLVNVARGRHVDTDALVTALREKQIGGAALDVTDPEPLPDDHPLWTLDRCIITPHVGNTPEMGQELLTARVRENVARFAAGQPLLGSVDIDLGY